MSHERSAATAVRVPSAGVRVVVSLAAGMTAAVLVAVLAAWQAAPLAGWDVACLVFLAWMWRSMWPADAQVTAKLAAREDPSGALADSALLLAAVVSLIGVGFVLVEGKSKGGPIGPAVAVGLGITSVVLSWAVVHTVFALRYAKLYYADCKGSGIDFNQKEPPQYSDFAYLAFTIGMTFQVSDTDLRNRVIRATALRHMWLSYLFGTVIIATTINLVAGLAK
jgi:uncharacterized membrane protein